MREFAKTQTNTGKMRAFAKTQQNNKTIKQQNNKTKQRHLQDRRRLSQRRLGRSEGRNTPNAGVSAEGCRTMFF